jgi:hypothetical protein
MTLRRRPAGERFYAAACRVCQRDFTARIDRPQKYCSRACSGAGRVKPREACARCGDPMRDRKHPRQRFCSRSCSSAAAVRTRPPCRVCGVRPTALGFKTCSAACGYELRKQSVRPRPCPECGTEFRPAPSALGRGAGKHCSMACYRIAHARRPAFIEVACAQCGAKFRRTQAAIKRVDHSFCSLTCSTAYYSGENAVGWRGGKQPGYRGPGWPRLAEAIRERDGFRCRRCGKHQDDERTRLSVDHVIPYRSFDNREEANQPTNLVALCRSCHSKKARAERLWLRGDVLDMWTYQIAVAEPWKARA